MKTKEVLTCDTSKVLTCDTSMASSWIRGKIIGKGSFGTVSIGVSKSDGRIFAVKSVDRNSGHVEALESEIRILRSLSSPYVVGFLGDDTTSSHRNLHMEYLPGGTLADVASPSGGKYADVDELVVRYFTWCVAHALRYVHARGVVHCDVKGRNVLVGSNGCVAKLADFGSAVERSSGPDSAAAVKIMPRGSPLWMAPEVIRRETQGPESDVWSLGCTVIEMFTGKPVWDDCGYDTLSRIGYSDDLPEFPSLLSELGCDFLEKCLRRKPSERWSCDQLLQHPFLLSTPPNKLIDSSPRCVLAWVNSDEFAKEDEEEIRIEAEERIGKLATSLRVNWEFDEGWVKVRALRTNTEATEANDDATVTGSGSGSGHEDEGTSLEYADLMRVEEETEFGISSECLEMGRANLEVWKCDNFIYSLCCYYCVILRIHYLLQIYLNILLFGIIYIPFSFYFLYMANINM